MGRALLNWLAFCLLLPGLALADFKRDYGTGLKALQDGDLDRAVADFEKAIAENPDSAERVRIYGMRFEPYLPHYYLGEAKFRRGDCAGALAAWRVAEQQGVIQGQDGYAALQANQSSCSRAVLDPAQLAAARQAVQDLRDTVAQMEELRGRMGDDWTGTWQGALDAASQRLNQYTEQLAGAEAASDASAVDTIAASAQGETANLQALWTEASQRLASLQRQREAERLAQARSRARVELTQAVAGVRGELTETVSDPGLAAMARDLGALADRGSNLPPSSEVRTVQNLTRQITTSLREYRQAARELRNREQAIARRTPPDELRRVAELYFAGRYDEVPEQVDPANFSDDRARLQALLFRAAARFNAYTLSGESEESLLRGAENDIRTIKRLQREFAPYLAAFPPKFLTLFENTL